MEKDGLADAVGIWERPTSQAAVQAQGEGKPGSSLALPHSLPKQPTHAIRQLVIPRRAGSPWLD